MSEVEEGYSDITKGILEALEELEIKIEDFKVKIRGKYAAHEKIIDEIRTKWRETDGFGKAKAAFSPRGGTYGLDFLGRDFERGRILLAVEVDTWWMTIGSWQKLADIRAENKVWVYVPRDEKAKQLFDDAIVEITDLLRSRGEKKQNFGNFCLFMKGIDQSKTHRIY